MKIGILSTYPPRECGIASFSKDLRDNLVNLNIDVSVFAIDDAGLEYGDEVVYELNQYEREGYLGLANFVSESDIDLVIVQHEYGIFGGDDGAYVLEFTGNLKKPYILCTHTVLPEPSFGQHSVLEELGARASAVVCMTERSKKLLVDVYGIQPHRIHIIPHGVPNFTKKDRDLLKNAYGFYGRTIVSTFGFVGPGKGLEIGIKSIALLKKKHPEILYLILGETHPNIKRREGEAYRDSLKNLVESLGLSENVFFVDRYLSVEEIGDYLYMTDVYLTPYPNPHQAVSGTLSYALGCGRAIVSTPYDYSIEMLAEGRGLVSKSRSPEELSKLIDRVISNPILKNSLERQAGAFGKNMLWKNVALSYKYLFKTLVSADKVEALLRL